MLPQKGQLWLEPSLEVRLESQLAPNQLETVEVPIESRFG
jgi:hypothetical protein